MMLMLASCAAAKKSEETIKDVPASVAENAVNTGKKVYFAGLLFSKAEKDFNLTLAQILEEYGYEVFLPQRDGIEAFEMFKDSEIGTYAAILMDVRMPVMDGLEATAAIRKFDREDSKKIPIIALTANAFDEDVQITSGRHERSPEQACRSGAADQHHRRTGIRSGRKITAECSVSDKECCIYSFCP